MIVNSSTGVSFLKSNRKTLIQRVGNVKAILDDLVGIIASELLSEIKAMPTSQSKIRSIFEIIEKQGFSSQLIFFNSLWRNQEALIDDIKKRPENN